ncbi:MAG: DUF1446 domain-containing protein [Chlamydiia bacterium]|nr:DUF1446 domain-containing protein [Chlamydiia bacterium]
MTRDYISIGNAQGFWGDDVDAPRRLVAQAPQLDYLTLDYLAEVSLSIMAIQRDKDPSLGYARDFIDVVRALIPFWQEGCSLRLVSNAGGLNPRGCADAVRKILAEADCPLTVGIVEGDDVLSKLRSDPERFQFHHWETGEALTDKIGDIVTANAYIGADQVAEALAQGADIVITGRVADPSMAVGCCQHAYGWATDNYDCLAGATVAGHLIECGTQVTGGISNQWLELDDPVHIGYPIVHVFQDGSLEVTKPDGTGGKVDQWTVKEQLLYEIGDPTCYLSPDVCVDFTQVTVEECGPNRVRVAGAKGKAPTKQYKVSATYRAGWRSEATLTVVGYRAAERARRAGEVVLQRLKARDVVFEKSCIEVLGSGDTVGGVMPASGTLEAVLRIAVADSDRSKVERFGKEIAPLVTSGPAGTTGYTSGRPKARAVFGYWPCLIDRSDVHSTHTLFHVEEVRT